MKQKVTKPVTHSIRVEGGIYQELMKEAASQSISFNNFVNKILKKHIEFDRYIPDLQFLLIHKILVRRSLLAQRDDAILSTAEEAGGAFTKDTLLAMGFPLDRESLLYFIETVLCHYKRFAECQRHSRDGKESFYLRHDLGEKWSLFLKGYIIGGFKSIVNEEVKVETTKDGITFVA